jgi:sugar lactone lactonase YvrE
LAACLVAFLINAPAALSQDTHQNAQAELQNLLKLDEAAKKEGDSHERLTVALRIKDLLNDASDAVLLLASTYSATRDTTHAIAMLAAFADLGQGGDNVCKGNNIKFEWLGKNPAFKAICARLRQNEQPISVAKVAFSIPDTVAIPEDIDYDRISNTFLLTSILNRKIFRVGWDGHYSAFASSPSGWPMMAIKIDSLRRLVWATEVALHGFVIVPRPDWDRSAILCFGLSDGRLIKRIEGPPGAALGDMVLDSEGRPVVSDGTNGGIYRLDGDSLARIDKGDFISPQTIALSADRKHLIVPDYARGIGIMDLASRSVKWMRNGVAAKCPVNGIDGIYVDKEDLFITQNGVNPQQITDIRLDRGMNRIIASKILLRDTVPCDPTHGVIVGGNFYFITNSGWNRIDDSGRLKNGATLGNAKVMRY